MWHFTWILERLSAILLPLFCSSPPFHLPLTSPSLPPHLPLSRTLNGPPLLLSPQRDCIRVLSQNLPNFTLDITECGAAHPGIAGYLKQTISLVSSGRHILVLAQTIWNGADLVIWVTSWALLIPCCIIVFMLNSKTFKLKKYAIIFKLYLSHLQLFVYLFVTSLSYLALTALSLH